jgi:hypothetical protein
MKTRTQLLIETQALQNRILKIKSVLDNVLPGTLLEAKTNNDEDDSLGAAASRVTVIKSARQLEKLIKSPELRENFTLPLVYQQIPLPKSEYSLMNIMDSRNNFFTGEWINGKPYGTGKLFNASSEVMISGAWNGGNIPQGTFLRTDFKNKSIALTDSNNGLSFYLKRQKGIVGVRVKILSADRSQGSQSDNSKVYIARPTVFPLDDVDLLDPKNGLRALSEKFVVLNGDIVEQGRSSTINGNGKYLDFESLSVGTFKTSWLKSGREYRVEYRPRNLDKLNEVEGWGPRPQATVHLVKKVGDESDNQVVLKPPLSGLMLTADEFYTIRALDKLWNILSSTENTPWSTPFLTKHLVGRTGGPEQADPFQALGSSYKNLGEMPYDYVGLGNWSKEQLSTKMATALNKPSKSGVAGGVVGSGIGVAAVLGGQKISDYLNYRNQTAGWSETLKSLEKQLLQKPEYPADAVYVDDEQHGKGKFTGWMTADKSAFILGKFVSDNNPDIVLIGNWKDNKMNGLGLRVRRGPDGIEYYYGQWKSHRPHGEGEYVWPDGGRFKGTWSQGNYLQNSQGTLWGVAPVVPKGRDPVVEYSGTFVDNEPNGEGTIVYRHSGNKYQGGVKEMKPQGVGRFTWASGDNFIADAASILPGMKFAGNLPGGIYYSGNWSDGLMSGQGGIYYPDGKPMVSGQFRENVYITAARRTR